MRDREEEQDEALKLGEYFLRVQVPPGKDEPARPAREPGDTSSDARGDAEARE